MDDPNDQHAPVARAPARRGQRVHGGRYEWDVSPHRELAATTIASRGQAAVDG